MGLLKNSTFPVLKLNKPFRLGIGPNVSDIADDETITETVL